MIADVWSNTPIMARNKKTGEVVIGFTDGKGHFDVYHDHDMFSRYPLSEFEEYNPKETRRK